MVNRPVALFLATSGHSGVDRIMINLIHAFADRGLRVDLLRVRHHGPHLPSVPANVRIVDLGVNHVAQGLIPLVRYLRRERPLALLADKDKVNRLALWARRLAAVPTRAIVRTGTTVSLDLATRPWWQRQIQTLSMRRFYPWADAIVVPSQGAARDLAEVAGLAPDRVQVIPNPIVTPALLALAAQPVDHPWLQSPDIPVVLGVGELCARKDFSTLVRAFAQLRQRYTARLVILGKGRQRERLEGLARELGIDRDLSLPGFVSNPYAYMRRASLFVLSSRYEGFGNVLVEALAVGTPVVSTDCPSGPREILEGGRHGRLVPVGDVLALAEAMRETLEHPPQPAVLRAAAERFQVENSAAQYLTALGVAR
jgi:glycosyltransferase involved in cell wall biosynthesis